MIDPENLPDELTVTLRRPVEFAGQPWPELKLREPTAGDMKAIAHLTGAEATVHLIFRVSGVPVGAIDKIGARDLRKAADYLMGFLADAPSDGASD